MSTQVHSMVHTRHIPQRFLSVISGNAKIRFNLRIFFSRLMINITFVMMGVFIPMSFTFRTSKDGNLTPQPPFLNVIWRVSAGIWHLCSYVSVHNICLHLLNCYFIVDIIIDFGHTNQSTIHITSWFFCTTVQHNYLHFLNMSALTNSSWEANFTWVKLASYKRRDLCSPDMSSWSSGDFLQCSD